MHVSILSFAIVDLNRTFSSTTPTLTSQSRLKFGITCYICRFPFGLEYRPTTWTFFVLAVFFFITWTVTFRTALTCATSCSPAGPTCCRTWRPLTPVRVIAWTCRFIINIIQIIDSCTLGINTNAFLRWTLSRLGYSSRASFLTRHTIQAFSGRVLGTSTTRFGTFWPGRPLRQSRTFHCIAILKWHGHLCYTLLQPWRLTVSLYIYMKRTLPWFQFHFLWRIQHLRVSHLDNSLVVVVCHPRMRRRKHPIHPTDRKLDTAAGCISVKIRGIIIKYASLPSV